MVMLEVQELVTGFEAVGDYNKKDSSLLTIQ
jgi:hypothetical protein